MISCIGTWKGKGALRGARYCALRAVLCQAMLTSAWAVACSEGHTRCQIEAASKMLPVQQVVRWRDGGSTKSKHARKSYAEISCSLSHRRQRWRAIVQHFVSTPEQSCVSCRACAQLVPADQADFCGTDSLLIAQPVHPLRAVNGTQKRLSALRGVACVCAACETKHLRSSCWSH